MDDNTFYVESSEGKISYRVTFENDQQACTCGDYTRGIKADPSFRCKHIISVYNSIPNGEVQHGQLLARIKPWLDECWVTEIEGREFVKYPGLLDLGHQKGIAQVEVDIVQLPTAENGHFAVCKASVVSKTGESFVDIGDASPGNCSAKVGKHLLRMASTRAIARALRSYCNIGMTALEELDPADLAATHPAPKPTARRGARGARFHPRTNEIGSDRKNGAEGDSGSRDSANVTDAGNVDPEPTVAEPTPETASPPRDALPRVSEAQLRALNNLSRRRGISEAELTKMALDAYGVEPGQLPSRDASALIRHLQTQ